MSAAMNGRAGLPIRMAAHAVLLMAAFFFSCSLLDPTGTDNTAGTGSSEGNGGVVCKLVYPNGEPVTKARIELLPRDTLVDTTGLGLGKVLAPIDTLMSSDTGRFHLDSIEPGTYVIEASDTEGKIAFIDSVVVVHPDSQKNVSDTLKAAGSITGVIKLSEGGDPKKVAVLAYGLGRYVLPDTNGVFLFDSLAEGTYRLILWTSLDRYKNVDTTADVISSESTDMDTLELPFTGIPTPKDVKASYDTLNGIVTLSWKELDYPELLGYVIYRNDTSATIPEKISGNSAITDTSYKDNITWNPFDSSKRFIYVYRLKTQAKNANLGEYYSTPVEITVVSPRIVQTFMRLGSFNTREDTASIHDTVGIIVEYGNATRGNRLVRWYVDTTGTPLDSSSNVTKLPPLPQQKSTGVKPDKPAWNFPDSLLKSSDTLHYSWKDPGTKVVRTAITDDGGAVWVDSIFVQIVTDQPTVTISGNTTMAIGKAVTFTAHTSQAFGTIVKYRWDNGIQAGYNDSTGSTYTYAFQVETTTVVGLEVTDDDGNTNTATHTVVVTNDDPVITGLTDTSISINDVVTFIITANDSNTVRPVYYWDFGDNSANAKDTTVQPTASHQFPATAMTCTVSVTAQDTFANFSTHRATIRVLQDVPTVYAGPDTLLSVNDTLHLHGVANDSLGSIVMYEWDFDGSDTSWSFSESAGPDTVFIATRSRWIHFRVRDDDGNTALDSLHAIVSPWSEKAYLAPGREDAAAAVVQGKIYVIGGRTRNGSTSAVSMYDPLLDNWTDKASLSFARNRLTASSVGGRIYAIGGSPSCCRDIVEEYDPTTNTWTVKSPMPTRRSGAVASVVDNKIYVIGGRGSEGELDIVEEYVPSTDSWSRKKSMPIGRDRLASGVVGQKIYVFGGPSDSNYVEAYTPAIDSWESIERLSTNRVSSMSASIDTSIFVIGGEEDSRVTRYHPLSNTWKTMTAMPRETFDAACAAVDGKIYVIGGCNRRTEVYEYDPSLEE